jgi:DNA-binding NtrC family response regulator
MLDDPGGNAIAPLDGQTVLLVDDEQRLRTIVTMMIEDLGARVIQADSGERAVAIFAEQRASIDLVLLDLRMRGLTGTATFRELLKIEPQVKVVVSSGVQPSDAFLAELSAHGGSFIEKPFDVDRLATVLATVLARSPAD